MVKVQSQKALKNQEGKLKNSKGAYELENQSKVRNLTNDFRILNIATHNINSLKASSYKLEELLEWTSLKDLDIIGINETNILEQQRKFLINRNSKYLVF